MELKINVSFEQVLNFVRQLSYNEKIKLIDEIQTEINDSPKKNNLQKILLNGPTWSEDNYNNLVVIKNV